MRECCAAVLTAVASKTIGQDAIHNLILTIAPRAFETREMRSKHQQAHTQT